MRRAARCCLLRLLIDGCGVVDAAVGDKSGASLHVAAEREGIACGFARDVGDRVPERDDRDGRAVVDPREGIHVASGAVTVVPLPPRTPNPASMTSLV